MSFSRSFTMTVTALMAVGYVVGMATAVADEPVSISPSKIDSLMLTGEDVKSYGIDFVETISDSAVPAWDTPEPGDFCMAARSLTLMNSADALRRVAFDSRSNYQVVQAVGVFSSPDEAKATVDRYADNANKCVMKDKQYFRASDGPRVTWSYPTADVSGEFVGNQAAWEVQAVDNVVVLGSSSRFDNGPVLAEKIAGALAQKVRDAG
jgi:hypothetical protein